MDTGGAWSKSEPKSPPLPGPAAIRATEDRRIQESFGTCLINAGRGGRCDQGLGEADHLPSSSAVGARRDKRSGIQGKDAGQA